MVKMLKSPLVWLRGRQVSVYRLFFDKMASPLEDAGNGAILVDGFTF